MASTCTHCGLPVGSKLVRLGKQSDEYCCYGCYLMHSLTGVKGDEARPTLFLARLGFAAFLAMNAQTFTWALYGQDLPFLFPVEQESRQTLNYVVFVLSVPVYLLLGLPFLKNAVRELRQLLPGVDSLIAVGTTAAFLYSVYSTFTGSLAIYYDTATMVLVLVTFGRYLEASARARATHALGVLAAAKPAIAHVMHEGTEHDVLADTVIAGTQVKVLPGEQVPVDGTILEGTSSVDESILTGEAAPVRKTVGDPVLGGSINHEGSIVVESVRVAGETYLSRLHRQVEEILKTRSRSQELADRIARYFTPAVILLAILTSAGWWIRSDAPTGLLTGLSVLLIACPCGLGIGAALAASVAYARAAHRGVIVKNLSTLERIGKTRSVFLDKTGTLTEGKPRVERFLPCPHGNWRPEDILEIGAALESRSEHPFAQALREYTRGMDLTAREVLDFRNIPGYGVTGVVDGCDGVRVGVRITRDPDEGLQREITSETSRLPLSTSYIYLDDVFSGKILVDDHVRSSAPEAVAQLHSLGVRVSVISGDNVQATRSAASQAGIAESRGSLRPEEKMQIVAEAAKNGGKEVCMVGDGVNDAAALAAAGIGVTLGSGTEFARSSSDITIMDGDLRKLPWVIAYGRRLLSVIRWNFFWVFVYNVIGIGLAVAGQIRPVYAALAMVVSSALVIANSSRMSRAEPGGSSSGAREGRQRFL